MSLKDLCWYLYKEPDQSSLQSHNQLLPLFLVIFYILLLFLLVFKAFHLIYIYGIVT